MRNAIREIPDGVYAGEAEADGFDDPIHLALALTVKDGGVHCDFEGTSPQSAWGITIPSSTEVRMTASRTSASSTVDR